MARAKVNVKLVALAIEEAGSTDTGAVSLKLEEILDREMRTWKSYRKQTPGKQYYEVCARLERLGIERYSDVARLIEEAQASA
jgi:hypothetical protein